MDDNKMKIPTMMTIKEAAKATNLPEHFIRKLIWDNKIIYSVAGNKYFVNVDKFIEEFPSASTELSDDFYYCSIGIPAFKTGWELPENTKYTLYDGTEEYHKYVAGITVFAEFDKGKVVITDKKIRARYTQNGSYFSQEQLDSKERICYVSKFIKDTYVKNDVIELHGQEYKVVGIMGGAISDSGIDLTWYALPSDTENLRVYLEYKRLVPRKTFEHDLGVVKNIIEIDDDRVRFPELLTLEQRMTWQSLLLLSGLLAFLSGFIICLIYKFIQEEREKNTAVYELTGCTRMGAIRIFMGEIMVELLFSVVCALAIFRTVIFRYVKKHFEYYDYIYNTNEPILLVLSFCAFVLIIMFFLMVFVTRKTPKELLRAKE